MVLQNKYCENCGEKFIGRSYAKYKWCKPCQLKENFTNWTSENEKVDNLIQKIQLSINHPFRRRKVTSIVVKKLRKELGS